jgi:hypothetical protein
MRIRRRLRQLRWIEWKRPKARRHNLIVLGSSPHDARHWAGSGKGPRRMSGSPPLCRTLNNGYREPKSASPAITSAYSPRGLPVRWLISWERPVRHSAIASTSLLRLKLN